MTRSGDENQDVFNENDTNSTLPSRDKTLQTKVVVRRLPPNMTCEEFLQQIDPIPEHDYFYYVNGDPSLGQHAFSRAYINFVNPDQILLFKDQYDGYVFLDSTQGTEYPAVVEFAPFQKCPKLKKKRKDLKCGTIEQDPDYLKFIESLSKPVEVNLPSLEMTVEELETKDRQLKANRGVLKVVTPLIEYVSLKATEKQRLKDERREERRRRDQERRNRATALKEERLKARTRDRLVAVKEDEILEKEDDDLNKPFKLLKNEQAETESSKSSKGAGDAALPKFLTDFLSSKSSEKKTDEKERGHRRGTSDHAHERKSGKRYSDARPTSDGTSRDGSGYDEDEAQIPKGPREFRNRGRDSDNRHGRGGKDRDYRGRDYKEYRYREFRDRDHDFKERGEYNKEHGEYNKEHDNRDHYRDRAPKDRGDFKEREFSGRRYSSSRDEGPQGSRNKERLQQRDLKKDSYRERKERDRTHSPSDWKAEAPSKKERGNSSPDSERRNSVGSRKRQEKESRSKDDHRFADGDLTSGKSKNEVPVKPKSTAFSDQAQGSKKDEATDDRKSVEKEDGKETDESQRRRIRNKDRPSLEIYRPGRAARRRTHQDQAE